MGLLCCWKFWALAGLAGLGLGYLFINDQLFPEADPAQFMPEKTWFGPGERPAEEDVSIRPFTLNVSMEVLKDLGQQLEADLKRLNSVSQSVEGVNFTYGFHHDYLKKVIGHWKHRYTWKDMEKKINMYHQFQTNIDGIDFHFIHMRPGSSNTRPVLPLLILHGWPGSFIEFLQIIPLLINPPTYVPFAFEVVIPSLPGFGFTTASYKEGCDNLQTARMLKELMHRLGHGQFYAQGGDWGGVTLNSMAVLYPESVLGLHVNFVNVLTPGAIAKSFLATLFPSFFFEEEELFLLDKMKNELKEAIIESGYLHEQATKPDTLGASLVTSPTGLAAWILEKFSTATDLKNRQRSDGGLMMKFQLDGLLTNVMIYWVTGTGGSAARFYLENFRASSHATRMLSLPVKVPTGIAVFPNELSTRPKSIVKNKFHNLVTFDIMPRGGHFAAMEEPRILAHNIYKFIGKLRGVEINRHKDKEEAEDAVKDKKQEL